MFFLILVMLFPKNHPKKITLQAVKTQPLQGLRQTPRPQALNCSLDTQTC